MLAALIDLAILLFFMGVTLGGFVLLELLTRIEGDREYDTTTDTTDSTDSDTGTSLC